MKYAPKKVLHESIKLAFDRPHLADGSLGHLARDSLILLELRAAPLSKGNSRIFIFFAFSIFKELPGTPVLSKVN